MRVFDRVEFHESMGGALTRVLDAVKHDDATVRQADIAEAIGMDAPNFSRAKIGAVRLTDENIALAAVRLRRYDLIEELCRQCGGTFTPNDSANKRGISAVHSAYTSLIAEGADVNLAFARALQDGELDSKDKAAIRRELVEMQTAINNALVVIGHE